MACLKGPLSQHQGGLPGARPSWETWHVGGFLATLPTGHSESTQELGPLNEPKEAGARAQGGSAVQIGLESWVSPGLGSPHYTYCPGWLQVLLAPSCSYPRTSAAPQKSLADCGASRLPPPHYLALANNGLLMGPAVEGSPQQSLQLASSTINSSPNPILSPLPRGPGARHQGGSS